MSSLFWGWTVWLCLVYQFNSILHNLCILMKPDVIHTAGWTTKNTGILRDEISKLHLKWLKVPKLPGNDDGRSANLHTQWFSVQASRQWHTSQRNLALKPQLRHQSYRWILTTWEISLDKQTEHFWWDCVVINWWASHPYLLFRMNFNASIKLYLCFGALMLINGSQAIGRMKFGLWRGYPVRCSASLFDGWYSFMLVSR